MHSVNHLLMLILAFFLQVNNEIHIDPADELLAVDAGFSHYSALHGQNQAFLQYCHEEAVMLVDNSFPVKGRAGIAKMLGQQPDSSYTLTWEPLFASCAASGEMGYTYGVYTLRPRGDDSNPGMRQGTYVTIWKRDEQQEWKFVLDSGNEGLGKTN